MNGSVKRLTYLFENPNIMDKKRTSEVIGILNKVLAAEDPTSAYDSIVDFFNRYVEEVGKLVSFKDVMYYIIEGNIGAGKTTLLSR